MRALLEYDASKDKANLVPFSPRGDTAIPYGEAGRSTTCPVSIDR